MLLDGIAHAHREGQLWKEEDVGERELLATEHPVALEVEALVGEVGLPPVDLLLELELLSGQVVGVPLLVRSSPHVVDDVLIADLLQVQRLEGPLQHKALVVGRLRNQLGSLGLVPVFEVDAGPDRLVQRAVVDLERRQLQKFQTKYTSTLFERADNVSPAVSVSSYLSPRIELHDLLVLVVVLLEREHLASVLDALLVEHDLHSPAGHRS